MAEKHVERKYYNAVKAVGGLCIKMVSPTMTGIPDRLILLPGGIIWFVEFKFGKGTLSARQTVVKALLERLGFTVKIINEFNVDQEIEWI